MRVLVCIGDGLKMGKYLSAFVFPLLCNPCPCLHPLFRRITVIFLLVCESSLHVPAPKPVLSSLGCRKGLTSSLFFWCLVLILPQLLESILHQSVNSSSFTCKYFSMCFLNTENMCRILINRIYYLNGAKSMKLFAASVGLCGLL